MIRAKREEWRSRKGGERGPKELKRGIEKTNCFPNNSERFAESKMNVKEEKPVKRRKGKVLEG